MSIEKREAAKDKNARWHNHDDTRVCGRCFNDGVDAGFDAGAASVDRAEIVRMFEAITGRMIGAVESERLDEYLAEMEKQK